MEGDHRIYVRGSKKMIDAILLLASGHFGKETTTIDLDPPKFKADEE